MDSGIKLKIYIYSLSIFSIVGAVRMFYSSSMDFLMLTPMLCLVVLAELFKIKIMIYGSEEQVSISWSSVMTIGAFLSLGVPEAVMTNLVAAALCSLYPKPLPTIKILYNISSDIATLILTNIAGILLMHILPSINFNVFCIIISFVYVTVNYSLMISLMRIVTAKSYKMIFMDIVGPHIPHFMVFAIVGGVLGASYREYKAAALIFVLIFVAFVIYSLKLTMNIANKRIRELHESNEKGKLLVKELDKTLKELIQSLTTTIDARDPKTFGHSIQVSNYAVYLAKELDLDEQEIEKIKIAGLLHDIGKISTPESIIFKPGKLTKEEYEVIKQHAIVGQAIISKVSSLSEVAVLVGMHHERYDGNGYPRGMKDREIPISASILAVSDALDTILSDRAYKKGKSIEEALDEIKRCKETQFNPEVVDALFRLYNRYGASIFKNSAEIEHQELTHEIISQLEKSYNFRSELLEN